MSFKLAKINQWQSLWPFHKKTNLWEKFETLWFSLIAIMTVAVIAFGLRTVIDHQIIGTEKLYISPSSYSMESTDFFDSKTNDEAAVAAEENGSVTFDPFIIPVARAQTDASKTNIVIKK